MIRKQNTVNPIELKGEDKLNHIRGLMGKLSNINEGVKPIPAISISKKGPDGKVYAIIRENAEYFIKIAEAKENLTINDFKYIGGLQNKRQFAFETYNKATRVLNNKLTSLFESYGIETTIDTFKSDKLVKEEYGYGFVQEEKEEELLCDDTIEECGMTESDDIEAGKFTKWCKSNGFDGPSIACAKKAYGSSESAKKMAVFYMNTVKPGNHDASYLSESEDMSDLTDPKEDKENSGDNLEGGFPDDFGGSESKIPSIKEALNSEDPILPEGYMDLMFKKKK